MKTYLVVERPERLEAPGGEFEILHGSVMSEAGLSAWAPRALESKPGLDFVALADVARAKGFAVFALPTKGEANAPGMVVEEIAVGDSRKVLVRHTVDWKGTGRLRWQGEDGGVIELEAPGWLLDYVCSMSKELMHLRAELKVKTAELETTGKFLDGMTAECARLKAGMPIPPSARGRGRKVRGNAQDAPVTADPATDTPAPTNTPESPVSAPAPARKYRGSGGEPD